MGRFGAVGEAGENAALNSIAVIRVSMLAMGNSVIRRVLVRPAHLFQVKKTAPFGNGAVCAVKRS